MRSARLPLVVAVALAIFQAGCSNPCRDLGDRICDCQPEGQVRTACKNDVKNRINVANPTSSQEDVCTAKLDTCPDPNGNVNACDLLNTCQGKVDCGLALPPPEGCVPASGNP